MFQKEPLEMQGLIINTLQKRTLRNGVFKDPGGAENRGLPLEALWRLRCLDDIKDEYVITTCILSV